MSDLTKLLQNAAGGDSISLNQLYEQVYGELRAMAVRRMVSERPGHTLQATALVHEAYLRLGGAGGFKFENRAHFFSAAAEAMRRILVDRARRRQAAKRQGGLESRDVDAFEIASPVNDDGLLRVDEALEKFAAADPRKAELVKLRYFVGMSFDETATALGITVPVAKQWWAYARAWLTAELRDGGPR